MFSALQALRPAWTIPTTIVATLGYIGWALDLGWPAWALAAGGTLLLVAGLVKAVFDSRALVALPAEGGARWTIDASRHHSGSLLIFLRSLKEQTISDLECVVEAPDGTCTTTSWIRPGTNRERTLVLKAETSIGFEYPVEFERADQVVSGRYGIQFRGIPLGVSFAQPLARGALSVP